LAFFQQPLEHQLELELLVLRFLDAAGDVLEVHEHRQLSLTAHPCRPFIRAPFPRVGPRSLPLYVRRSSTPGRFMISLMKKPDPAVADRVPPGQVRTEKWPVLTYGRTPRFDPARWTFRCVGLVERPTPWTEGPCSADETRAMQRMRAEAARALRERS